MQKDNLRFKTGSVLSFSLRLCGFGLLVFVVFGLCGCAIVRYLRPEGPPSDTELYETYSQTELNTSSAAEVLGMIHDPEYELLSQSKSVIAAFGQKKKGYKRWFNMVAFDENELTARRKYFFVMDEESKGFPFMPKRRLRFESKMIMEREVLGKPYADQNARRLAILRDIMANFDRDMDEVGVDNKQLDVCGMLVNQTLGTILQKLDESPVLASKLSDAKGVPFDHITLGKGRIRMDVARDIVDVKVRVDAFADKFQDPFSLRK